jgi:formylglycine-generating enzyme required for sulfatase activity
LVFLLAWVVPVQAQSATVTLSPAGLRVLHAPITPFFAIHIASASPITKIDLAVNGQVVATQAVPNQPNYNAVFAWQPTGIGDYTIVAVATDQDGAQSQSAATALAVREPLGSMIAIPAATFRMGDGNGPPDEKPERVVTLNAYEIDRFEVTVGEFRRFVIAKNFQTSAEQAGKPREETWRIDDVPSRYELPVRWVSWWDAESYCTWAGKRLLSEAEWEHAARGTDQRRFPWGNDFDPARVPSNQDLWPVGTRTNNVSPLGVYDMAGNVWEWMYDWYDPQFYGYPNVNNNPRGPDQGDQKVMRGGSFTNAPDDLRTTKRIKNDASSSHRDVGFRCGK